MTAKHATTQTHRALNCRNCGAPAPGQFCADCGQSTALHPPSVGEFVHEFIGHYIAFEGKLWKTLGLLFFKPGQLTKEYLAGRKQRYVLPLRLYLTISLIFFLTLGFVSGGVMKTEMDEQAIKQEVGKSEITVMGLGGGDSQFIGAKLNKDGSFECNMVGWLCVASRTIG